MKEKFNSRKAGRSVKIGDITLRRESYKKGGYIVHGIKKTTVVPNRSSVLQLKNDDVKIAPVRVYTKEQIEKLNQFPVVVNRVDKKSNQKWLRLKNILLGITEEDLLRIERREWNKIS